MGIVVANDRGQVLWARRVGGRDAWQFPQGGINRGESPEEALYRELHEEIGLEANAVEVLAATRGWLRYRLPRRFIRKGQNPVCIGQKQKWFLLRMLGMTVPYAWISTTNRSSTTGSGSVTGIPSTR